MLGPLVCIGGQMVWMEWRWCKGGMAAAGMMADDGEGYGIVNLAWELPTRHNFWRLHGRDDSGGFGHIVGKYWHQPFENGGGATK